MIFSSYLPNYDPQIETHNQKLLASVYKELVKWSVLKYLMWRWEWTVGLYAHLSVLHLSCSMFMCVCNSFSHSTIQKVCNITFVVLHFPLIWGEKVLHILFPTYTHSTVIEVLKWLLLEYSCYCGSRLITC